MGIFSRFRKVKDIPKKTVQPKNYYNGGSYDPIIQFSWTGEKTPGELRPTKNYIPDYTRLSMKSWQAFTESDIAQICINTHDLWTIGSGLIVKPEPVVSVLEASGIQFNNDNFSRLVSDYFKVICKSRYSDHSMNFNFHINASMANRSAIIGGDVLHIFRYTGSRVSHQIVDGRNIMTPFAGDIARAKSRGNKIIHGVEVNNQGRHIAFYVYNYADGKFSRIAAYGEKSKRLLACMEYGSVYRIDEVRGMPLLSSTLETISKMDRYKEAAVGSAEERQKIGYFAEHNQYSTGENPVEQGIRNASDLGLPVAEETVSGYNGLSISSENARKIAMTTQKQFFNMPIGATLKQLESKNELYFKDFFNENFAVICAVMGQPPEIALKRFTNNFSASRMAAKVWEHQVNVNRAKSVFFGYQNFYNLNLEVAVRKGRINIPGYLESINSGDFVVKESFQNARFLGPPIPHVDPVKEVKAERLKLGNDQIPLTSASDASERLNLGDYTSNIDEFSKEYEHYIDLLSKDLDNQDKKGIIDGGEENVKENN